MNTDPVYADLRTWFYGVGTQHVGPMDAATFMATVRNGTIRAQTPVWSAGMDRWLPASSLPQLTEALQHAQSISPETPPIHPGPLGTRAPFTDNGMLWILPVGRSPFALIAGYLGLLSLLGVFAPFAILLGILALRQIKQNPHMHGAGRAWFGIVMGTLMTLLYGIGLVASAM